MMKILKSNWMVALVGAVVYLGTTVLLLPSASSFQRPPSTRSSDAAANLNGPSWSFRNPALDQMVEELRQEKVALAAREQQFLQLEARIRAEQQNLATATQLVARLQKEFDQNVVRLKEQETTNLKRLAKTHAAMSPEGSANILKELSDEEVTKVLVFLKADEAGPILEAMGRLGKNEARRAAVLSDRLRRILPAGTETKSPAP